MSNRSAAWFHCFSGIAGDMALGSLLDAGADLDEVRSLIDRLPIGGWKLSVESVMRGGLAGTKARVETEESGVVRTAAHIVGLLEEARLPDRLRGRALAAFDALANAEGRIHNHPPAKVHFHEVGGLDAIVDVVGTCSALEVLDVGEVYCSPIAQGLGMIRSAHGQIPNPAPAVVELLRGAPTYGLQLPYELTTPTGATLMASLATGWGPMPAMRIEASGFGAGDRDMEDQPNLVQVVLGQLTSVAPDGQPLLLLEANLDDATGEVLADAIAALFGAGAADAWVTPILMKKGRPGHTVSALCDLALGAQLAGVMKQETGSLGIRGQQLTRWPAARTADEVEVEGRAVRVKVSAGRVKIEHDDASRVARHTGKPVREVISLAEEAWRRGGSIPAPPPVLGVIDGMNTGGDGDDTGGDGDGTGGDGDDAAS